jgi:hypothetical protein
MERSSGLGFRRSDRAAWVSGVNRRWAMEAMREWPECQLRATRHIYRAR